MSTTNPEITVSRAGHVATVVIDRPPNNHVSVPLMRALADQMEALDADPGVRAIVLASAGSVEERSPATGVGSVDHCRVAEILLQD